MQKITPFLWFDGTVEAAMKMYCSVFPQSKVLNTSPGPGGTMMSATFELEGQQFIAFNGGPHFKFTPAISMYVNCESQAEVDDLWAKIDSMATHSGLHAAMASASSRWIWCRRSGIGPAGLGRIAPPATNTYRPASRATTPHPVERLPGSMPKMRTPPSNRTWGPLRLRPVPW